MVLLPMVEPAGPPQQSVEAFLTSARYRATYDAERAAMQRQLQAAEARAVRAESRANNSEATLAQLLASKRARVSKDSELAAHACNPANSSSPAPPPTPPAAEPYYQKHSGTEAPPNSSAQQRRAPHADDEWEALRDRLRAAEERAEMLENQMRGGPAMRRQSREEDDDELLRSVEPLLPPGGFAREDDGSISPCYTPRVDSASPTTRSAGLSPKQQEAADLASKLVALAVTSSLSQQQHRHRSPSRTGTHPTHQQLPRAQETPRMACGRSPPPRNLFYSERRGGVDPLSGASRDIPIAQSASKSAHHEPLPALGGQKPLPIHVSPPTNLPLQSRFDPKPFTPCGPSGFGPQSPRHARVSKRK